MNNFLFLYTVLLLKSSICMYSKNSYDHSALLRNQTHWWRFCCNRRGSFLDNQWLSLHRLSSLYVVRWYYQDITQRTKFARDLTIQSIRRRVSMYIRYHCITKLEVFDDKTWKGVFYICVTFDTCDPIVSFYKLLGIFDFTRIPAIIDKVLLKHGIISHDKP